MSGLDLLKEIKKSKQSIPVLILTATEDIDIIVKSIKLGADNYFIKGKGNEELQRMYEAIIDIMEK